MTPIALEIVERVEALLLAGLSREETAQLAGVALAVAVDVAEGRRRSITLPKFGWDVKRISYTPSPEAIAKHCAAYQATWSPEERERRTRGCVYLREPKRTPLKSAS